MGNINSSAWQQDLVRQKEAQELQKKREEELYRLAVEKVNEFWNRLNSENNKILPQVRREVPKPDRCFLKLYGEDYSSVRFQILYSSIFGRVVGVLTEEGDFSVETIFRVDHPLDIQILLRNFYRPPSVFREASSDGYYFIRRWFLGFLPYQDRVHHMVYGLKKIG